MFRTKEQYCANGELEHAHKQAHSFKTLLPALVAGDSHLHFTKTALFLHRLQYVGLYQRHMYM